MEQKQEVDEEHQRFSPLKALENKITCMHRLLSSLISSCRGVGDGGSPAANNTAK